MGKIVKAVALIASSLWLGFGLTACSSSQLAVASPAAATFTPAATNLPKISTLSATLTSSPIHPPTHTPTSTASPVPSTPSPRPPTLTSTALACTGPSGRIETGDLTVEYLPSSLNFNIYLPPCYDEQPDRRYPVLYLIHGQGYTDNQWIRLGVPEICDSLIASGELPPFLVVMPGDRVWKQPSEDKFGQALLEELVPWVESHYRTLPGREHRAIGGLSRGAAWAVHLGLSQWESFGAIGAHSLPVFLEDVSDIDRWIDQIPIESFPRLYLDIGDQDRPEVLESAIWFEELLTKKDIPHEWHLFSGEHDETYWHSHVEQYLRWYAAEW
jgi:enterochelin esterase-like enzyme